MVYSNDVPYRISQQHFKMTWFMNFCAPFIPNDPTINFHRFLQGALLALYTFIYTIIHIYFQCCANDQAPPKQPQPQKSKQKERQSDSDAPDSSEQSSQKSKEVSIKVDEHANQSCIELRKTGSTWGNTTHKNDSSKDSLKPVSLNQIESYFPIVYGHFAIAMGLSIMYTPYAEQSIASLLYMVLTIPLMILNSKRYQKSTTTVWILMAILLIYIFTCGLLEVGQSNWDYINLTCFSNQYVSLYG